MMSEYSSALMTPEAQEIRRKLQAEIEELTGMTPEEQDEFSREVFRRIVSGDFHDWGDNVITLIWDDGTDDDG